MTAHQECTSSILSLSFLPKTLLLRKTALKPMATRDPQRLIATSRDAPDTLMRMVTASAIIMSMAYSPATVRVMAKAMARVTAKVAVRVLAKAMVKDMDRATAITATGKVSAMVMVRVAGARSN